MLVLIVGGGLVGLSLSLLWFFKLMSEWDEDSLGYSQPTQIER